MLEAIGATAAVEQETSSVRCVTEMTLVILTGGRARDETARL